MSDARCSQNSRVLYRAWLLRFFFFNVLVVLALFFPYVQDALPLRLYNFYGGEFHSAGASVQRLTTVYLLITCFSYSALLVAVALTPSWGLGFFSRMHVVGKSLAVIAMSVLLLISIVDKYVFYLFRFHISATVIDMITSPQRGDIFSFSRAEWSAFIAMIAAVVVFEIALALTLSKYASLKGSRFLKRFLWTSLVLFALSVYSWVMALVYGMQAFAQASAVLPLYNDIARHCIGLSRQKMSLLETSHLQLDFTHSQRDMRYPLKPLQCGTRKKPVNLLVIMLDSWRFDAMDPEVTPHLAAFAQKNLYFSQHYSGGNATQPGIFSFFYSLPNSYWTAVKEQHFLPVLMQRLSQLGYQMAVYASASLAMPDFVQTIFREVPNLALRTEGESSYRRDQQVTIKMIEALQQHDPAQPFFGFAFYDSAHDYCGETSYLGPFKPTVKACRRYRMSPEYGPEPLYNRYRNAVHFLDAEVHQILKTLEAKEMLDNTIVMISGDHGEEFNDNGLNYWGHTSNFTKYQLQVPLLMHWPGKAAEKFTYLTSHYDIVPTLFYEALSCTSSEDGYSFGKSLFDSQSRYPLIVANNYMVAYITKQRITSLYPSGDFKVQDRQGRVLEGEKPDKAQFLWFLNALDRFYNDRLQR